MKSILCCLTLLLSGAAVAADGWESFWASVKVSPPPPRDFLDGDEVPRVRNLTDGHLPDATVKQWVDADLRRGRGDSYATVTLRRDIADAGVFGPPGLNGTSEDIDAKRARGAVRIERDETEYLAAGVIRLPPEQRGSHFTEYVIVLAFRPHPRQALVLKNGMVVTLPPPQNPDQARWRLDTGRFIDHPVLGPIWYQQDGWSCHPGDGTETGALCGRLEAELVKKAARP